MTSNGYTTNDGEFCGEWVWTVHVTRDRPTCRAGKGFAGLLQGLNK